ncbi:hypothetical protein FAY30_21310 [Bacillus sp. S3]|uniref:hypothetical protein n=1 Tax=Bacillus sp. S3 TaxID=486398 RepID=UPI0011897554|nr:hypothetical protein [Bacillus sp. S3]QCJ44240.1 hypothetical protein FAY30_21310 [Bacillus sp. S3]
MLPSPDQFDRNEWFIIISLIVMYTLIFLLPKRFPHTVTLIMLLFSMTYVQVLDHILAGLSFNLYDINDVETYEWFDLITWFLYPPFGYFFVYFFDKWSVRRTGVFWYIFLWVLIAIGEEALSLKFNIFTYIGWKLSYSIPVYFITLSIYLLFFLYIKGTFEKYKNQQAQE